MYGSFINTYKGVNHSFLRQRRRETERRWRRYPSLLRAVGEWLPLVKSSRYSTASNAITQNLWDQVLILMNETLRSFSFAVCRFGLCLCCQQHRLKPNCSGRHAQQWLTLITFEVHCRVETLRRVHGALLTSASKSLCVHMFATITLRLERE